MSEEQIEFKKQCDETLYSIYSKINEEEKIFLSYVINQFNNICESNNKAIEYIEKHIIATETENILLEILKGENSE